MLEQHRSVDRSVFPDALRTGLPRMFYTERVQDEVRFEQGQHPEYRWEKKIRVRCLDLLPIYQTAAALSALSRCGLVESPEVEGGFDALLSLSGLGVRRDAQGPFYTDHWCACNAGRWLRGNVAKFGPRT